MIAIFQIHFSDVGLDEWYSNPIYIMQLHVDKCRSNLFEDVYNYFLICFMILLFLVLEEEFISHDMSSSSSKFSRHHHLRRRLAHLTSSSCIIIPRMFQFNLHSSSSSFNSHVSVFSILSKLFFLFLTFHYLCHLLSFSSSQLSFLSPSDGQCRFE